MSTDTPEVKPLEDCTPEEVFPQDTSPYEVYCACLFHGTHKVPLVEIPVTKSFHGIKARVGTKLQPVSVVCSPQCGVVFLGYRRGCGPECHCLDTPGPQGA